MPSLHELLQPQVIIDVISRIREGQGRLQRLLGMHLRGKNIQPIKGRYATFRIFDHDRVPAMGRAPGTGPAVVSAQPVGQVHVQMARFHEKVVLDYESLGNLSPLSGPNAQVDAGGQDYIHRQEMRLAEHMNNAAELMVAGMLRGQFYMKYTGENLIPYLTVPSGNYLTIDEQIPAGNKSQLNMLGAGNIIDVSWDNQAAPILKHLLGIKAAFAQLHGRPLANVLVNSSTWYHVINNTEVRNTAGTSMTPFETYDYHDEKDLDGEPTNHYVAVLKGDPTVQWHIIDDVIAIDGTDPSYSGGTATLTKLVADNTAVFLPSFDSIKLWAKMCHGSEYVVEYPNVQSPQERQGLYAWSKYVDQPSAVELITLLNALPVLEAPKHVAYGTVVF